MDGSPGLILLPCNPEIVDQLKGKGERGRRKDQRAICCLTASSGPQQPQKMNKWPPQRRCVASVKIRKY